MHRLQPLIQFIFHYLIFWVSFFIPVTYILFHIPNGSPVVHYIPLIFRTIYLGIFYAFIPLELSLWTLNWYTFQNEMRDYETCIWDEDWIFVPGVTVYHPEIHMYRHYERSWERFCNPNDPYTTLGRITRALKMRSGSEWHFMREIELLDEFLGWKKRRPGRWNVFSRNSKEREDDPQAWLRGTGIANLQILWETLQVRARTLGFMAEYTLTVEDEESEIKAQVVNAICAEYSSVKKHMQFFRSRGWASWLGECDTAVDKKLLVACNSLKKADGVWDRLADADYMEAMSSVFRRSWKGIVVYFDRVFGPRTV
ncbi:hypothetical protein VTL71DRAFT_14851 [Oculimacula yallundae]|uniref:Uncharacterized protein n=1 Tax=Oculimacula yallundae TaxID=86028 RepID=A0ABR4CEX7_9HELO